MQQATTETDVTIAVLSKDYLEALYNQPEWAAAFANEPTGKERKLIPVRVGPCSPTGMLSLVISIDLIGLGEQEAEFALLQKGSRFLGFQEFEHLLCNPSRGGGILTGDEISVSNAIRLPRLSPMKYCTLVDEGCFQFERHIVFGVILFFLIRERRDVFAIK